MKTILILSAMILFSSCFPTREDNGQPHPPKKVWMRMGSKKGQLLMLVKIN